MPPKRPFGVQGTVRPEVRVATSRRPSGVDAALARAIFVGLVLLVWTPLVVAPQTHYPFIVGKALFSRTLIELLAALWAVLLLNAPSYRPRRSTVVLAFLAYLATALLSTVFGVDLSHSLWSDYSRMMGLWDLGHWFLAAVIAASVLRGADAWRRLLAWNIGALAIVSVIALGQSLGLQLFGWPLAGCRVHGTLGNPSYLAALLVVGTWVAMGFLSRSLVREQGPGAGDEELSSRRSSTRPRRQRTERAEVRSPFPWARVLWAGAAALFLWVLFLTGTRGALAGLAGAAIVLPAVAWLARDKSVLRPVVLASGGVLLAAAIIFVIQGAAGSLVAGDCQGDLASSRTLSLVERVAEQPKGPASDAAGLLERLQEKRVYLVQIGLAAFADRPLLGWGQENFARAFDRFAPASLYRLTDAPSDHAHNKVIEELATKGLLGTIAYLALWGSVVVATLRSPGWRRDKVFAYGVLGALIGYFVQDLFLFDTPATMMQWMVLVGWAMANEDRTRRQDVAVGDAGLDRPSHMQSEWPRPAWAVAGAAIAVTVLLAGTVYWANYRPLMAARTIARVSGEPDLTARLALADKAFAIFPGLSMQARQEVLEDLARDWGRFTLEEKELAYLYAQRELTLLEQTGTENGRLLSAALALPVAVTPREQLDRLGPALERLRTLAPERVHTHQLLARYALRRGDYEGAVAIARAFQDRAPNTTPKFQNVQEVAERALADRE